ncbi:MAG: hypothetical protein BWY67_02229 [Bacteroidetes bacterium ADurb.Bin397]|nr:MAG: hypothetical protein BWY67_02229 [Bacteroidetes bacterium ADurb.Bin397]
MPRISETCVFLMIYGFPATQFSVMITLFLKMSPFVMMKFAAYPFFNAAVVVATPKYDAGVYVHAFKAISFGSPCKTAFLSCGKNSLTSFSP